ncbi:MAG: DUF1295 domain-containing protein [Rhodothermia bacterium]|nr:DUF1295 domain-containing protein [Rhodothermia bacterium]
MQFPANILETGLTNLAVILACMGALWGISLLKKDASIVDPFWPVGFAIVAWTSYAFFAPSSAARPLLIVVLTTIWGLRLGLYLLWRNWGAGEDYRYAEMREKHGDQFWIVSLFTVFLLQGVLMWVVSWPVQFGQTLAGNSIGWLDYLGVTLWLVGFVFESVGDYQLARFKSDPNNKGKVLDSGLWRYTRHPNYFGDFCVWWGLYLIAVSAGAWWTLPAPLLMSFLLMKFSGAALLESTITDRRPAYADYISKTPAFFPGKPKA